jgi:hypothetical protein
MPSDSQPRSQGSVQTEPDDGATPVRHRSSVRTLLGLPASASAVVLSPVPMPLVEFGYASAAPHSSTEMQALDQALADELLNVAPDSEWWSGQEDPPDSTPVHLRPAQLEPRSTPTMRHSSEAQPLVGEQSKSEPEQIQNPSPVAGPIRQNTVDAVRSLEEKTIPQADFPSEANTSAQHTTIIIPGTTVRRPVMPGQPPVDQATSLSATKPGGLQAAYADAGQSRRVEELLSEGQSETSPGNSMNTMLPEGEGAERPHRAESSAVRSNVLPPTDSLQHSLAGTPRGAGDGPDSTPPQPILSPMVSPLASADAGAGKASTPTGSPVTGHPNAPEAMPATACITVPASTSASGTSGSSPALPTPAADMQSGMDLNSTNIARHRGSEQGRALRPAISDRAPPAAVVPLPVAPMRPEVESAGGVTPPTRHTAEQIAQLQRTVAELAAQVAAREAEQRASKRDESIPPPPAQPVVIVEPAAPPARTPAAFWERSYLSRLSRWPRR